MCGIFGLIKNNEDKEYNNEEIEIKMIRNIKHRGPDASIIIDIALDTNNNYYKMGFHRLSIVDKTFKGMQPFKYITNDRSIYVMCNGEIYNHTDLRTIINSNKNYHFESQSDCEVILPLYLMYGLDFVNMLEGDFAISIFDISTNNKKLHIIKDRIGFKSLHYFYDKTKNIFAFCSEQKGLMFDENIPVINFEPSTILTIDFTHNIKMEAMKYYNIGFKRILSDNIDNIMKNIKNIFIEALRVRIPTDTVFEFLLSGGLDSSLTFSVGLEICLEKNINEVIVNTIGMEGATDIPYAIMVVNYCRSKYPTINIIHNIIHVTKEECIEEYKTIPYVTESFDVTTNRASTQQKLCMKKIKERNPNIKIIIVGDFSDEVCSGYLYFHKAPNHLESHQENIKLCNENYLYDLTRVEKCCSYYSIEPRSPFTCYKFYEYYLSIPPEFRSCMNSIEKALLRNSFEGYLPHEILYRQKEAFSDGCSSTEKSWFQIIREFTETLYTDDEFKNKINKYNNYLKPIDKESLFIHEVYDNFYPNQYHTLQNYWTTKWTNNNVISARELDIYNNDN